MGLCAKEEAVISEREGATQVVDGQVMSEFDLAVWRRARESCFHTWLSVPSNSAAPSDLAFPVQNAKAEALFGPSVSDAAQLRLGFRSGQKEKRCEILRIFCQHSRFASAWCAVALSHFVFIVFDHHHCDHPRLHSVRNHTIIAGPVDSRSVPQRLS